MPATSVTLLSKPGCHLCDTARGVVIGVLAEFAAGPPSPPAIEFIELSILDDPRLLAEYSEDIPVVLINGRVHNQWVIDPERLRAALHEASAAERAAPKPTPAKDQ